MFFVMFGIIWFVLSFLCCDNCKFCNVIIGRLYCLVLIDVIGLMEELVVFLSFLFIRFFVGLVVLGFERFRINGIEDEFIVFCMIMFIFLNVDELGIWILVIWNNS